MRTPHLLLSISMLALTPLSACSSDDDPSGGNGDGDGNDPGDGDGDDPGDGDGDDPGDGDGDGPGDGDGDDPGDGDGDDPGDGDMGGMGGMGGMGYSPEVFFHRVASFPVCMQLDATCNVDTATAAEIVTATEDGNTLVYTDSPLGVIGYVDITDPSSPSPIKTTDVSGEPTSVSMKGKYALVGVNTSPSFVLPSGLLRVYDIESMSDTPVVSIDLGGQPDSVAISPDGNYAAVVIENERDEELTSTGLEEGDIPQLPAGKLVVIDTSDENPANWSATDVGLTGLAGAVAPTDPEPEFVDINTDNLAVVTLQENNAIALVDLETKTVTTSFSAGVVDLSNVDATEEDTALVSQTESLTGIPREPDGVAWIGTTHFATADEGDWMGGSRGFSIFDTSGAVVFSSGSSMDHLAAMVGHYPEARSENKGNEPENVEYGVIDGQPLLFVNSERASLVFVYDVENPTTPTLKQILPAGVGPEGGLAIEDRGLLVVASEEDNRGDKIRSVLNIYRASEESPTYPTLVSADRMNGTPIPWAAMSGLAAGSGTTMYAIEDSFFGSNRIFTIDTSTFPATLTDELRIVDTNDVFASLATDDVTSDDDAFSSSDLDRMINDDKTVNIDPEGISVASGGGFWIASEGAGSVGIQDDPDEVGDQDTRPIDSLNLIFKVDADGTIEDVITLPPNINALQVRFGFEGIAEYDGKLYVAFQRAWDGEEAGKARIGIYDIAGETWEFVFYPLDAVTSQAGGWVGLSDITSMGDGTFLIVERDDQAGPDASIKRLYTVDLSNYTPDGDVIKTATVDLMSTLAAAGGLIPEKIEGSALDASGHVWIINDNDGVDDNSGETQLIDLGSLL